MSPVPDALFSHPRLARVYDAFDDPRPDLLPHLELLRGPVARTVVDVGCGTGNVARVFLTDDDLSAALRGVRRALRPGGASS